MGLFSKEEAKPYVLHTGKHLECAVCGFDYFYAREAQMHTGLATFFNFEWTGATAHCSVCGRCGHIHWFLRVV